ncbi:MAG: plastocyanin/azurin family copper-binding protein [Nitrosopumilaceae archaeon]|nr:plastocyanin/azurin family copper-binding protein [Nitrosopumilaceae archaeon]
MTTMDKVGIGIAIAVVAVALGFTSMSGNQTSDIIPVIEQTTITIKETTKDIQEKGTQTLEKVKETTKEVAREAKELGETTKELASAKSPSRLVSIPAGTSLPGCEEANLCYDPPSLIIFQGAEIIWKNNDNSSHTVTSGNIIEGPDGIFDSGLIKAGETFSFRFEKKGQYDYFCMIHPWASASVTVS